MLSVIQLVLAILSGVMPLLTKNSAPQEVITDLQAAIDSLTKVHGALVTKQQVDSLLLTTKW